VLQKGEAISIPLKAGDRIRIACLNSGQLANLIFTSYHQGLTLDRLGRFILRGGDLLYNSREMPALKVVEVHSRARSNIVYPGCRSSLYGFNKKGCRELLAQALKVEVENLPSTVNLFMDFEIDPESYEFKPVATKAENGDFVEIEALIDLEVAVAACPCEELSKPSGKIGIEVFHESENK
jgi:uncharacterized protein YcgI (DUF1989 family)